MRKQHLLWAMLSGAWLATTGSVQLPEGSQTEPVSLRTRVVLAVPWGDQASQVGRQTFPEAAHDVFPAGFCQAPDGILWISDWVNNRLLGFHLDPTGEKPAQPAAQVPVDHPTHVAANEEGVFIVDWPRSDSPEGLPECRLWHYVNGEVQQKAAFQDPAAGYLAGQLVALAGGDLLVIGDHLHRVQPNGEVQEVPLGIQGVTVAVSLSGMIYQAEQWESDGDLWKGQVKCWALASDNHEPSVIKVALPSETGPKGRPSEPRLIGADGAGRLYFTRYERGPAGSLRLTLAQVSPDGKLLAQGDFQPAGVDLKEAWKRCPLEFWQVTPEGRVLVALPTEEEYRILEAAFEPAS